MKSFLLTLFCVLLSFPFFSQKIENPITPKRKSLFINLREKQVKTQIESVYFLDEKEKNLPDKEEKRILKLDSLKRYYKVSAYLKEDSGFFKFVFNKHNDLISGSGKWTTGLGFNGKSKYDYDSDGMIEREFSMNGSGKVLSFKEHNRTDNETNTSIYDEKGQLLMKVKMVYDPINKIYTILSISSEKKIEFQNKIFMNDSGQVIKYERFYYSENIKTSEVYKYDDKGNKTEILITDENGKPQKKIVNKYNDKGLVIRRTVFEPVDKKMKISKFEYEFFEMSSE